MLTYVTRREETRGGEDGREEKRKTENEERIGNTKREEETRRGNEERVIGNTESRGDKMRRGKEETRRETFRLLIQSAAASVAAG